ncbi:uncharacterized protein LOC6578619 [Drosophila mojavensis]|uniref:Protein sleepless n=1 Tax=Drosophila mojavensis TaxID=7230 RepID=B4KSW5_DROMO|nr:uncharacterized protein LOC6578619 [Drosophila mojavensis]EDW08462.1 uncharacterized protein Dmoj_GI19564 [Drosophila mojavensis]
MSRALLTLAYLVLTYCSIVFTACVNNVTGTSTTGSSTASGPNSAGSLSTSLTSGGHIHRTAAAIERVNKLWCYACDTMDDGPGCVDVLERNDTSMMKKCQGEEFICMVKRFSYTTSTENSTSSPKMWSLDRRCTVNCEPGCIVIGERTKLYACTSCCEESFCNTGRGGAAGIFHREATGIGTRLFWLAAPCLVNISLMLYKRHAGQALIQLQ